MVLAEKTKQKPDPAAEKKKKEALAKARQLKHAQGAPPHGLTKSSVPIGTHGLPGKKDKDEEHKLDGKKAKKSDEAKKDPCGKQKPKVDLEVLAEKIFVRLLFEARIERERAGWELQ